MPGKVCTNRFITRPATKLGTSWPLRLPTPPYMIPDNPRHTPLFPGPSSGPPNFQASGTEYHYKWLYKGLEQANDINTNTKTLGVTGVSMVSQRRLPRISEPSESVSFNGNRTSTDPWTYRMILTSLSRVLRPSMALGVIKIYWRLMERRAAVILCQVSKRAAFPPPEGTS